MLSEPGCLRLLEPPAGPVRVVIDTDTYNVAEHLRTTQAEMERFVRGAGAIGDYLYEIYSAYYDDHFARSKELWDLAAGPRSSMSPKAQTALLMPAVDDACTASPQARTPPRGVGAASAM